MCEHYAGGEDREAVNLGREEAPVPLGLGEETDRRSLLACGTGEEKSGETRYPAGRQAGEERGKRILTLPRPART